MLRQFLRGWNVSRLLEQRWGLLKVVRAFRAAALMAAAAILELPCGSAHAADLGLLCMQRRYRPPSTLGRASTSG